MSIRPRFTLMLLCLAVMGTAWAATVNERQARDVATRFMVAHSIQSASLKTAHKALLRDGSATTGDKVAYYVFNSPASGYVIVAGDDRVPAVLGYSDKGNFDPEDIPAPMQEWLDGYTAQIEAIARGAQPDVRTSSREAIAPMLNVNWGQGMPYNVLLPHVNGSENAHAYVGCVAVAMAQVMSYWQYPARPTKTIPGYTSYPGRTYEVTMPSLAPMDFDWENMQNTYYTNDSTSTQCMAVADLMRYSTTAMQSSFGLTSTGSYTRNIPSKLIEYFGYKNSAHYIYREDFSTEGWEDVIYAELAAGRPVAYGGNKQSAGHAFVCDGYDGEGLFHINWGWAGKSNGYFLLNLLNPSAEGIGSAAGAYGYVKGQGAAIGIEPDLDGTDGEAAFSFEGLTIDSSNGTRSAASSNFSVTVSGKFVNKTNVTSMFRQGWGLYNSDGELVDVLFIRFTTSALGNDEYITVSGRALSFGAGITEGTYRILPIYSIYPSEDYRPCIGSDVNYIEVTFGGTYSCTIKGYGTAGSTTRYTVNSCTTEGTLNHGKPVTVTLNLKNAGTSTNDLIYMFVDGTFNAMGLANIAAGESGDLVYRFTPSTAGTKTLTFSLNESGSSPFYTHRVTINTMPAATLDVSYRILGITDEDNRIITADHYTIIADVTNTGTTTYDEDFSVRLYRINNNETNVGTELQSQTQRLILAPGESTSLQFDFDHDLVDGWRYFCYLYYYSDGGTVSKDTKWYTLNMPTGPVETHQVAAQVIPAEGGVITFTGGVNAGEAQVGKKVSFIVNPNEHYAITGVQAVTATGDTVMLNHNATTGVYSFMMPTEDVLITAAAIASHDITVAQNFEAAGRVLASAASAVTGQSITVTAKPNVGWRIASVTVTDAMSGAVEATIGDDGVCTFVMPDADVTVNVDFERSTGSVFELVTTRDSIVEGGIYIIATKYYDKVMKFHAQGEVTFCSTPVTEWLNEEKTLVKVGDEACFIQMTNLTDTIVSTNTRLAAYLTNGNGYMRTNNYNVFMQDGIVAESRAWMYIGTASNCLIRFKDTTSGSNGNWIVRYDNENDVFKVMNWSVTDAEVSRVWLYKLVPDEPVEPEVLLGDVNDDGVVSIKDVTALIDFLLSGDGSSVNLANSDVSEDGVVSIKDVTALIDMLLSGNN